MPPIDPPHLVELIGRGDGTVGEVLVARAARSPDSPMLLWGERSWTFAEGIHEIDRFAGWATSIVSPSSDGPRRIASFLDNCPEALWAWLGSLMSGAIYIPLNRSHRGLILEDMLKRSGADLLITDREGLKLLPDLTSAGISTVLVVDGDEDLRPETSAHLATWSAIHEAKPSRDFTRDPSALAELIFTSGTTGRSKAVAVPHNQLVRGGGWVAWSIALKETDVIHGWLPLFHIGGQLDEAMAFIIAGGALALQPTFSRSRFWQQVDECKATVFIGFSNVLEIIWGLEPQEADANCTLRAGIMGGIPPNLHRGFEERFGVRLYDVYGMTEAEPLVLPHPGFVPPPGSAGLASPDFEVAIVDEKGEAVRTGDLGHVEFRPRRDNVMMMNYEGDDEAFAAAMRNGWFRTGDLGRFDENGFFFFMDREKHAIRRRGENISSFELERIVSEHTQVSECCALGVPSPLGEEDVKIVVSPDAGSAFNPAELHEWCTERMAAFMVPRFIDVRPRLPRGPTGKVLKTQLVANSEDTYDAELARSAG